MQSAPFVLDAPVGAFDKDVDFPAAGPGHALPDTALAQLSHEAEGREFAIPCRCGRWPGSHGRGRQSAALSCTAR